MKNQSIVQAFLLKLLLPAGMLITSHAVTQEAVQVRFEPRHKPVFENQYVRILDVWLPPGDTTLYHIHSTPSLFNFYTDAILSTQIKKGPWEVSNPKAGFCWYRSFENDTLIHRIINIDSVPCHVMDVELLSTYKTTETEQPETGLLPFELLFENERSYAWHVTKINYADLNIAQRGPIVADLISGEGVEYKNKTTGKYVLINPGMYLFIEPNTEFHFTNSKKDPINMILFELK